MELEVVIDWEILMYNIKNMMNVKARMLYLHEMTIVQYVFEHVVNC